MKYILYRYLEHLNKYKYVDVYNTECDAKKDANYLKRLGYDIKILTTIKK